MDRLSRWFRGHPGPEAPPGVDAEVWAIFKDRDGNPNQELLQVADEIRIRLQARRGADPDLEFQSRLRASLMIEARANRSTGSRRPLLALPRRAAVGLGGLAVVAVAAIAVVAIPLQQGPVMVQAPVAGHHKIPVTQAIRISFNRPMDEASVVHGLSIKPAVSFTASWPNAKTLVISPEHGLAPNVGYVVTIAQPDAKAQNGAEAATAIVIPFGTGLTPSTPHGQIPTVVSITQVAVTQGVTALSYMPDGALLLQSSGIPVVTPSSTPSPSPSPSASPSFSVSAGPRASGLSFGTLYVISTSMEPVATDAEGAVASPDSQEIAYWTPGNNGTLLLDVVAASGSGTPETLAISADSDPGLAWVDNGNLLYSAAGQLREVSLDGQVTTVYPTVQVDPSGFFSFSPSSQAIYASPDGTPTVYSLAGGTATALSDLVGTPAWSATGSDLAYISKNAGTESIELTTDLGVASTSLVTVPLGTQLSDLSFDPSGTYLTYVSSSAEQSPQLDALDIQSEVSGPLGSLTSVSNPVWSPSGDQLSELEEVDNGSSQSVESLLLSGEPQLPASNSSAADAALSTASNLAQFQVDDQASSLSGITALLAPGTNLSPSVLLPGKFDRFYAISSTPTATGSNSYTVDLRLVRDATSSSGPAYLPETVTVQSSASDPEITGIVAGSLTPIPIGPQVISASAVTKSDGTTVFVIHFDSDLNPLTVGPQSTTLRVDGDVVAGAQFYYSPLTRTEVVTVNELPSGAVTLTVAAPLADIDNTAIQSPYQVVLQPEPDSGNS